ncbi:MAG: SDR family oxidoreductase [Chlorobiales bacterium]|jgi:enoyl-[acyl-carrier protein] reductase III|nr:SDR family oxidoreductase [Chlorobiales bacterium]
MTNPDNKPLQGQVALITGASRGIGKATALRLAEMGCNVAINYLNSKRHAESVVEEIKALGVDAIAIQADMRHSDQIKKMFSEVKHHFHRLDIFISNAAKGVFGPVTRIGTNGFDLAIGTGPKALLVGSQEAAKLFGEKGGRIIAVSSIGSIRYLPGYTALGTAKAAIETLVRYLAVELGPKKIIVNAVSGGPIDTDALDDFKDSDTQKNDWGLKAPLGRLGKTEDLTGIIAFLCTKDAGWIHGQTIVADGGLTLTL